MAAGFDFGLQVLTGVFLGRKADGARPVEALDHVNQAWTMSTLDSPYFLVL